MPFSSEDNLWKLEAVVSVYKSSSEGPAGWAQSLTWLSWVSPNLSLTALPGGEAGIHRLQNQMTPHNLTLCIREARDVYPAILVLNLKPEAATYLF